MKDFFLLFRIITSSRVPRSTCLLNITYFWYLYNSCKAFVIEWRHRNLAMQFIFCSYFLKLRTYASAVSSKTSKINFIDKFGVTFWLAPPRFLNFQKAMEDRQCNSDATTSSLSLSLSLSLMPVSTQTCSIVHMSVNLRDWDAVNEMQWWHP